MPLNIPPQEHAFIACHIQTRKPMIRHGIAEIDIRYNLGEAESPDKKVSKEIARPRQKDKELTEHQMTETTDAVMGGYNYWLQEAESLREAIGRERHRKLVSFLKFKQTLERQKVPELRQEVQEKMLDRFGTIDYQEHKDRVINDAIADPQLNVLVQKGQSIWTTRKGQEEYARERNASAMGDIKT